MPRVKQIIDNRELFYAEEHQSVADVARRMAELNVGAILVLAKGQLKGVFSERDLMLRVVLQRRDPDRTTVRDVMSTNLATIAEDADLDEAMETMATLGYRHLPVMCGTQVVGFLSMRDLMQHELAMKNDEIHHMRSYIAGNS